MCEKVLAEKAHIGIAFDGDADRVVFSDEKGLLIDGDQIMALIATDWHERGLLQGKGIAATLMSNLGLERYLETLGLSLMRTSVGDRYVSEAMRDAGFNVGGEQSGHVILSDYATTGDGLLTALQVLAVLSTKGKPASQVLNLFTPFPQILKNVKLSPSLLKEPVIENTFDEARQRLGKKGRLVVRLSGTEPLIRIMAEGEDRQITEEVVDSVIEALSNLSQVAIA
jgi:phosphoglucosamine mutase